MFAILSCLTLFPADTSSNDEDETIRLRLCLCITSHNATNDPSLFSHFCFHRSTRRGSMTTWAMMTRSVFFPLFSFCLLTSLSATFCTAYLPFLGCDDPKRLSCLLWVCRCHRRALFFSLSSHSFCVSCVDLNRLLAYSRLFALWFASSAFVVFAFFASSLLIPRFLVLVSLVVNHLCTACAIAHLACYFSFSSRRRRRRTRRKTRKRRRRRRRRRYVFLWTSELYPFVYKARSNEARMYTYSSTRHVALVSHASTRSAAQIFARIL